jgi:hypothetical protein
MARRPARRRLAAVAQAILVAIAVHSSPLLAGTKETLRDQPYHLSHFPPAQALAIDGLWESSSGERVRIQKGRAWDVTKRSGTRLDYVMWKDIEREAAGRYRAAATGCYGYPAADEPVTLSVVGEDRIAVRSDSLGTTAYRAVKLDARKRLVEEYEEARLLAQAPPVVEAGPPGVEIHRVTTRPAMVVGTGAPFDLVVDYTVTGAPTGEKTVPVLFSYSIGGGGKSLLEAEPELVEAAVGRPLSRSVHLTASRTPGAYELTAAFKLGGATAMGRSGLLIGESGDLLDRLAGSWEISGRELPVRLELSRSEDRLEISIAARGGDWRLIESATEVSASGLVWRGKDRSEEMDCWIEWETTLHFGSDLDELSGAARIVDGGWCVEVGVLKNETWRRVAN